MADDPQARVPVVVGIIADDAGRMLVNQRISPDRYRGKWEFPGGKMEAGETIGAALQRELREELGVEVVDSEPLITLSHDYPDRRVTLFVHRVLRYRGTPRGLEGQAIQWVAADQLSNIDFLEANHPVISAARLPDYYLITDIQRYGLSRTADRILQLAGAGVRFIVQFREKRLRARSMRDAALKIREICRGCGIKVVGNMPVQEARALGLDGVHLSAAALNAVNGRPCGGDMLVGTSCHNRRELQKARLINADFAVLSPVLATASHPDASILGWRGFEALCCDTNIPVYALGGMRPRHKTLAKRAGGQGVAMLSQAWGSAQLLQ